MKTKTEKVFTLSYYGPFRGSNVAGFGHTVDDGKVARDRSEPDSSLSFAESLSPLNAMIYDLHEAPLGSKVKVTMEIIDEGE